MFIGRRCSCLLGVAVVGRDARHRAHRRRRRDASTSTAIAAAVLAVPRSCSRSVVRRAAGARPRDRGRAAAARRPVAGVPTARGCRLLDLARRRGAGRGVDRRQRRPGWRRCRHGRPLPRRPHRRRARPGRRRRVGGPSGAHHPRARHEHAPRAAVRVVGAGRRRSGLRAGAAGAHRCTRAALRSITATGAPRFGGNLGIGTWIGFAFTQPATFVYAVPVVRSRCSTPIARRPSRRLRDARCGLHRHRPRRHRRSSPASPRSTRPTSARRRRLHFGDCAQGHRAVRASSTCCRCSVASSCSASWRFALRSRPTASSPRWCSVCSVC